VTTDDNEANRSARSEPMEMRRGPNYDPGVPGGPDIDRLPADWSPMSSRKRRRNRTLTLALAVLLIAIVIIILLVRLQ